MDVHSITQRSGERCAPPRFSYYGWRMCEERCAKNRGVIMRPTLKKIGMAALAAVTLAGATLASTSSAEARWGRGGWVGPAVVGGLALGAFAAATAPRYGYGPYGYYGGGYGCPREVVGYTPWGRPIVRRVCY
jgi:uncharacterized membrane protein